MCCLALFLFLFARPGLVLALTLPFSLCLIHAITGLFLGAHGCDRLWQVDSLDPIAIDPAPAPNATLPCGGGSAVNEPLLDSGSSQCRSDPERLHGIRGYWTLRRPRHPHPTSRSGGREGVKLTQFYAAAPFCTPARIALLTGRYQQRAGRESTARADDASTALPTSEATLASLLKGAGYANGMFGKWHLGYEPRFGPNAHGFDEFFGFHDWTVDYFSHRTYTGEPGLYENTTPVEREGYITELLTDRAVSFIDKEAANPFFLYVSYNAALPPAQPPDRPWDIRDQETWDSSTRQDYAKVVEALDAGIGRILDQLDHRKLAEKTLVIFSYDHGPDRQHCHRQDFELPGALSFRSIPGLSFRHCFYAAE